VARWSRRHPPRRIQDGTPSHRYVLTCTQWSRITYSIGIATSPDLQHWTKHGPAFLGSSNGKYDTLKYKSGGIVTTLKNGRLLAARINGKYWLYWGEGAIHLATSLDLIHWTPLEDGTGTPIEVLTKRPGHFDSGFPEVGPHPCSLNLELSSSTTAKTTPEHGDPALGANAYAAGEALFDKNNPARLVARNEDPSLKPERPYERTGQYLAGTTFAEGFVRFHNRWFLYYGCADSAVGVATAQ
jgi:predicted GH43/DUF377 family glycosyl hydrolase